MVNKNKFVFLYALIFTLIIFGLGLILGFFVESSQSNKAFSKLIDAEINILDDQIRNRIINDFEIDCKTSKKSLFNFADKIYFEAKDLENLDSIGRLTDIIILHKRYDLLRTLLWIESRDLKERCNENFNIVVYLYQYITEDVNIRSKQIYYSNLLFDLKSKNPENVILIPIAVDTGLSSAKLVTESKGITEFPVIIINNKDIIDKIITLKELENYIL